jgi:hypothetical protein
MPAGKGYKVTSKDQLGKGMAKKRTKQVEIAR